MVMKTIDAFEEIKSQLEDANIQPHTKKALEWYRNNLRKISQNKSLELIYEVQHQAKRKNNITPMLYGNMFQYVYNAKFKSTLPYWDAFPLVIPFNSDKDHVWCINLHYLQPKLRMILFSSLLRIRSDNRWDERTKLKVTWKFLSTFSKSPLVMPCVKCYRLDHIQTKFLHIPSPDWEIAVFLPTEAFHKATKKEVWNDSNRIINS